MASKKPISTPTINVNKTIEINDRFATSLPSEKPDHERIDAFLFKSILGN